MVQSKLVRRMSGPTRAPQHQQQQQRTPVRPPRPARAFSADLAQRPNRSDLWRFTVKPDEEEDVIDLGAPRAVLAGRSLGPARPTRITRTYTPNPRLYPGPPKQAPPTKQKRKPSGQRTRRNKNTFRRPVPNSRLYRPAPPRPPPPPANPRTVWQPPAPALALETASRAALRLTQGVWWPKEKQPRASSPVLSVVQKRSRKGVLGNRRKSPVHIAALGTERRRNSSPVPPPKLVITLPAAAGDGNSTSEDPPPQRYRPASQHFRDRELGTPSDSTPTGGRPIPLPVESVMDATQRHSASPEDRSEGNDSLSAPSEFLAEFLSAIMRRQYAEALKYCRLILQYEPRNATARGFYPLLQQKLSQQGPGAPPALGAAPSRSSTRRRRRAPASRSPTDLGASSGNSGASSPVGQSSPVGKSSSVGESSPVGQIRNFLPHEVMEQDADSLSSGSSGSERASSAGEPEPGLGLGSGSSQSSLELDSSDAHARSTPSLSLSRRTDSGSASASGTWDSSGSGARDDNGNPAPAPPLACAGACDADNNAAAPARSPRSRPGTLAHQSEPSESLARLRAQFACSIK